MLIEEAFAEDALTFDAEMLNKLAPARHGDWSAPFFVVPLDFPVHEWVSVVHEALLFNLTSMSRLQRMIDNETRVPSGTAYTVAELMTTLTDEIMAETGIGGNGARSANSYRRNLQRLYINQVSSVLNAGSTAVPEDVRSVARYELKRISAQLGTALGSTGLDMMSRAHYDESKERIDRMLEAPFIRGR
jgi:hypothetical protein